MLNAMTRLGAWFMKARLPLAGQSVVLEVSGSGDSPATLQEIKILTALIKKEIFHAGGITVERAGRADSGPHSSIQMSVEATSEAHTSFYPLSRRPLFERGAQIFSRSYAMNSQLRTCRIICFVISSGGKASKRTLDYSDIEGPMGFLDHHREEAVKKIVQALVRAQCMGQSRNHGAPSG